MTPYESLSGNGAGAARALEPDLTQDDIRFQNQVNHLVWTIRLLREHPRAFGARVMQMDVESARRCQPLVYQKALEILGPEIQHNA